MQHRLFEWDLRKAASNLRKHGVSFAAAARALQDRYADWFHVEIPIPDAENEYGEERWVTVASDPFDRDTVFYIVWAQRTRDAGVTTRIISARLTTRSERRDYEAQIY